MALIPVLHRLIVKPEKAEEIDEVVRSAMKIGIHVELDKRTQAAVEVGIVISLGDTCFKDFKADVVPQVGDKIYYAKYAGKSVKDKEDTYICLNDEDVIAIIKE